MPEEDWATPRSSSDYRIAEVPGKGRALIAARSLPAGARLVSERAFFTAARDHLPTSPSELAKGLPSSLVSNNARAAFMAFHNARPELGPVFGRLKTNAIPLGETGSVGMLATICLINHSCSPNTSFSFNEATQEEEVHTLRDISSGEELTITYGAEYLFPSPVRQAHLQSSFGFTCSCDICALPSPQLATSDAHRTELAALLAIDPSDPPLGTLRQLNVALDLLAREAILPERGSTAYLGFQICAAWGDAPRAREWAREAARWAARGKGEGSELARRMRQLEARPEIFEWWAVQGKAGEPLVGPLIPPEAGLSPSSQDILSKGQKKSARAKAKKAAAAAVSVPIGPETRAG